MNLLFDFDGTIVNSFDFFIQELSPYIKNNQLTIEQAKKMSSEQLIKSLNLSSFQILRLVLRGRSAFRKNFEQIPMIDGMSQVLRSIASRHDQLYLCSSNSKNNIKLYLKNRGLDGIFKDIETNPFLFGKARGIQTLMKRHGLHRDMTYYIGDETRDIKSARQVGIKSVAVCWGYQEKSILHAHSPDFIFEKPEDLLSLF